MDFLFSVEAGAVLLLALIFIDENAVLELRLFFHALTKAVCHLYLAVLPLRRAFGHYTKAIRCLFNHSQQLDCCYYQNQSQPLIRESSLHFLEGMCVVWESMPDLIGVALSVGAAMCHMLQSGFCVLQAILRTSQALLFEDGEKARWDKEQQTAKEQEKKSSSKVRQYISVFCQDPISSLRMKP